MDLTAYCGWCGAPLGRLSDPDQDQVILRHADQCEPPANYEGLIKDYPILWQEVHADG